MRILSAYNRQWDNARYCSAEGDDSEVAVNKSSVYIIDQSASSNTTAKENGTLYWVLRFYWL